MVHQLSSLADATRHALESVHESGSIAPPVTHHVSPASRFGTKPRSARELLGFGFSVRTGDAALVQSRVRPIDLGYAAGLLIWSLQASDDPSWLAYYHPRAADYAQEPGKLCGAFGKRLLQFRDSIDQVARACQLIENDTGTRRAAALVLSPEDDPLEDLEYPCAIGVQLFAREGELHWVTYMRAQQVLTLLPYDGFLFMSLQCVLADRLKLRVGRYIHFAGTLHYYVDEEAVVRQIIEDGLRGASLGNTKGIATRLPELYERERAIRSAATADTKGALEALVGEFLDDGSMAATLEAFLIHHALRFRELSAELQEFRLRLRSELQGVM